MGDAERRTRLEVTDGVASLRMRSERLMAVNAFVRVLRVPPAASGADLLLYLSEQKWPAAIRASTHAILAYGVTDLTFFHGSTFICAKRRFP
jgi:hypothetical protein